MPIKTKKIPAYTLSEMIVVLLLTTIVVGLAFSVLQLVQKQIRFIQTNWEKTTEIRKLEQSLSLDFNRYHQIRYNPNEKRISFKNVVDSTFYQIRDSLFISEKDTFQVRVNSIQFYRHGQEVLEGKMDAIKLKTHKDFQEKEIFVFRINTAKDVMEWE